jgi:hypothetical protein
MSYNYLEECAIAIDSAKKGEIPTVVSLEGTPLQTLSQCDEWKDLYKKAHKSKIIRKRAGGLVVRDNDPDPDPDPVPVANSSLRSSKPKRSTSSRYVELDELSKSDSDLPYPDVSRKAPKHHRTSEKRRQETEYDSSNSHDIQHTRKRRKEEYDEPIARSKKVKRGGSKHHYSEGRSKKKKETSGMQRVGKGKNKAVHISSDEEPENTEESGED